MSEKKSMSVSMIRNGTVIDHIKSEVALKVLEILKLSNINEIISVAYNLKSKRMGTKGIIKVGGKSLSKKEIQKIALIAPDSTMSIIENYKVKEKLKLEIPDEILGVAKCINPNCISNAEPVKTLFKLISKNPFVVRCHHCERSMSREDLILK